MTAAPATAAIYIKMRRMRTTFGRRVPAAAALLACALAACSSGPAVESSVSSPPIAEPEILYCAEDSLAAEADTVASILEDETIVFPYPLGPDGRASVACLEALYDSALAQTARRDYALAEDVIFTLQDQILLPAPADADSAWETRRSSLERRLYLLGALLAEGRAFAGDPAYSDSLLAAGYHALDRFAIPDSLVPATGTELPPLVADLLEVDNGAVRKWINYFTGAGRRHFKLWLTRKTAADSLVGAVLEEHDLPRELVYLALIESGLSPRARSSVGAAGPWQFMPGTARRYGLQYDWWVDERRDLELSTHAAARYLRKLYDQFGNWALVLAAYNTGENRVERQVRLTGHDNYWRLRLPRQTSDFVPKFIAAARIGENPQDYGFDVPATPRLGYDTVNVNDATDLALIASCAGVAEHDIAALNPALLRGATPPQKAGYPVRVPRGTGARTTRELRKVPLDERLTWRSHRIRRGETLSQIASHYGTTTRDLAHLNGLVNPHLIRPGDTLLIPMPASLAERARSRAAEKGHYVPPAGYERVSHTVRSGETLSGIARRLGVSVAHLRKVNNIHRTSLIYPGQRLYAYRPAG
jgi:membrane-bound lytic murein transglycosylase D